ncbi:hypothetical protein CAK95_06875 [Pseudorhodoplanes sinuspersici]|uniref:Uncharacterized protein n=1 Tax=Pseudorhodoplanes sinuspersici TaxID=1235591 RepID=A0A1W6ZNX6_9HYPH|nr:hypothetical protein CAK95_06875 [Pseudorhodoplanes sinuspersici]
MGFLLVGDGGQQTAEITQAQPQKMKWPGEAPGHWQWLFFAHSRESRNPVCCFPGPRFRGDERLIV